MESKVNYTVVGLVVLVLVTALLSTAVWLSVGFERKKYKDYLVYLRESAAGLADDSVVKYSGVKVGFVKRIQLNHMDPQQVILLLAIEEGTPITVGTVATLVTQGLTGVTSVSLAAENENLAPLQAEKGQPYPVIPARPSLFNQLTEVVKEVADNLNHVSDQINVVLSKENVKNLSITLENVQEVTKTLADNSKKFDEVMTNLAQFSESFPTIAEDMKLGLKKINHMSTNVSEAGKSVTSTMDAGKMTIKQISQQTVPSITILLRKLDAIAANLEVVSNQMRQNPAVVLRGTKAPEPGPGER